MKILLASIGSRGDVQPLIALALALRARGHEPRLCVAPTFREWIEPLGLPCIPIGPDLKQMMSASSARTLAPPSQAQRTALAALTVREQFQVIGEAASECNLIIAAGTLQLAARSIAEAKGIPYVFAAYAPVVFPSPQFPPPKINVREPPSFAERENLPAWRDEEASWNDLFRAPLNEGRETLNLAPVESVLPHILTERPWLAADPTLAPAPLVHDRTIAQTGAWLMHDEEPLPETLENFLQEGEAPIYIGFGSMRAANQAAATLINATRAIERRAILSRGWGNLDCIDAEKDCMVIGEVNHEELFRRVAAVVHHGGAGTTTNAARAGCPQVIVPHLYDQFYWAQRVDDLGVGVRGPVREQLSVDELIVALRDGLRPDIAANARAMARQIKQNAAQLTAERLIEEFDGTR